MWFPNIAILVWRRPGPFRNNPELGSGRELIISERKSSCGWRNMCIWEASCHGGLGSWGRFSAGAFKGFLPGLISLETALAFSLCRSLSLGFLNLGLLFGWGKGAGAFGARVESGRLATTRTILARDVACESVCQSRSRLRHDLFDRVISLLAGLLLRVRYDHDFPQDLIQLVPAALLISSPLDECI